MADKESKELIGFDPLAWMNEDSETVEAQMPVNQNQVDQDIKESVSVGDSGEVMSENEEQLDAKSNADLTSGAKLILDATLNIQNVSFLYENLLAMLEREDKIEIDASEVVSIDTATLQLLIILKQAAIKLQKEVVFDFPSDKFIESAELLGLAEMLEVDQSAAGFF